VVPVRKDRPAPAQQRIEPLGDADREPLHPSREPPCVRGFDDEVQVIALHRELGEANCLPAAGKAKRVGNGAEACPRSQAGEAVDRAQGDMHRKAAGQWRTHLVRHARAIAFGLAPGTGPLAAAAMAQLELLAH
jgi:hypothetical protein